MVYNIGNKILFRDDGHEYDNDLWWNNGNAKELCGSYWGWDDLCWWGWSGKCFLRNLAGFATIAASVTAFLDRNVPSWREAASWGFTYACAQVSWCIAQIAGIILPISRIAAGAIIVGGALAIIAMGEIEIF